MDEVEQKLGLSVTPLTFPIGMGYDFQGIYNIWNKNIQLFSSEEKQKKGTAVQYEDLNDPELENAIGTTALKTLNEELEKLSIITTWYPFLINSII